MLRESLLDSARHLLRERPWSEITMSDIARQSSVSRQTLYNTFGSRDGFVQAYVLYDADKLLSTVEDAIEAAGGKPRETIRSAFERFLEAIALDPLAITVLAGDDPDGILSLLTTRGAPVLTVASYRLGAAIQKGWPQARPEDVQLLAEELVRLAISHAALPQGTPAQAAEGIAALLGPFAEEALASVQ